MEVATLQAPQFLRGRDAISSPPPKINPDLLYNISYKKETSTNS